MRVRMRDEGWIGENELKMIDIIRYVVFEVIKGYFRVNAKWESSV